MANVVYDGRFQAVEVLGRVVERGEAIRVNKGEAARLVAQGWREVKDEKPDEGDKGNEGAE